MKMYVVQCPYCGKLNRNVYLEETNGWMECEYCSGVSRTAESDGGQTPPVRIISPLHIAESACKGA